MKAFLFCLSLTLIALGGVSGCTDEAPEASQPAESASSTPASGLSADELEHGIGPVRQLELGPIDEDLAARGLESFNLKCAACHKLDTRYVGPPLGDVLTQRTPEYVMNMMLNPAEMLEKHPEAKAMLAQYMTPMPNQSLAEDEAHAILEYLRRVNEAPPNEAPAEQ